MSVCTAKGYSSYAVNLAWLQSSTREPWWWLLYLKSILLEIQFVTTWLVFENRVTKYRMAQNFDGGKY